MSTIHRPAPIHLWWYAVAAVLAASVLALAITVLQQATPGQVTGPAGPQTQPGSGYAWHASRACFATRPHASAELAGVCATHLP